MYSSNFIGLKILYKASDPCLLFRYLLDIFRYLDIDFEVVYTKLSRPKILQLHIEKACREYLVLLQVAYSLRQRF